MTKLEQLYMDLMKLEERANQIQTQLQQYNTMQLNKRQRALRKAAREKLQTTQAKIATVKNSIKTRSFRTTSQGRTFTNIRITPARHIGIPKTMKTSIKVVTSYNPISGLLGNSGIENSIWNNIQANPHRWLPIVKYQIARGGAKTIKNEWINWYTKEAYGYDDELDNYNTDFNKGEEIFSEGERQMEQDEEYEPRNVNLASAY